MLGEGARLGARLGVIKKLGVGRSKSQIFRGGGKKNQGPSVPILAPPPTPPHPPLPYVICMVVYSQLLETQEFQIIGPGPH
jgi:hypothetical protein